LQQPAPITLLGPMRLETVVAYYYAPKMDQRLQQI